MKETKQITCSECKEIISCDDAGYGYDFKIGQELFCKKSYGNNYHLHYHDISQMDESIRDTLYGEQDYGRTIRSYGNPAKAI